MLINTSEVFFNVDGLPPATAELVAVAMQDTEQLVSEHTGGQIVLGTVLSRDRPAVSIPA